MKFAQRSAYKGYRSFSYLVPEKDYKVVDWADWNWAGYHMVECTLEEEARVAEILKTNPYVSVHEHADFCTRDMSGKAPYFDAMRQGRDACAYEALSYSNIDCVFDNMMDGTNVISSPAGWKWIDIVHDLGMRLCDLAHQDFLVHCTKADDIFSAKREGKIAWVAAEEGAAMIENEVDRIDILYGLGVRQLGITYSESNALGSGCREDADGGLTRFGRECVERMNKVGMLIDVSHCGTQTAYDAVTVSSKPIIMSHTGAKAIWNIKRLAADELLQAVAERGGVIGIEAAPHTTMSHTKSTHDIDSFMEHFEYCVQRFGIDHVAFGPDCMYGDHVSLHHAFSGNLSTNEAYGSAPSYQEVPFVWGLENCTEASWNIPRWLVKHGYSDEDIAKVIGGNAIRVLREVWA